MVSVCSAHADIVLFVCVSTLYVMCAYDFVSVFCAPNICNLIAVVIFMQTSILGILLDRHCTYSSSLL